MHNLLAHYFTIKCEYSVIYSFSQSTYDVPRFLSIVKMMILIACNISSFNTIIWVGSAALSITAEITEVINLGKSVSEQSLISGCFSLSLVWTSASKIEMISKAYFLSWSVCNMLDTSIDCWIYSTYYDYKYTETLSIILVRRLHKWKEVYIICWW